MFHTTVKCVDCGTVMVDVPSNTKRCAACRVGHNRESVRKANEAERARSAAEAAEAFGKVFTKHVAQDIQDERGRRAEEKAGEKEAAEHEQKRENEPQAVY